MTRDLDITPPVSHKGQVELRQTLEFKKWIDGLRDRQARLRIVDRLKRLAGGSGGDTKSLGGGVLELRLHFGPGYRVYFTRVGDLLVLLLTGGDKASQARDIERARRMAKEAEDGIEDTVL